MTLQGWQSINFNWCADTPRFIVYGCDSALEHPSEDNPSRTNFRNFAKTLSNQPNFRDVEVWGQSTKSVPSYLPDYRVTSLERDLYSADGKWVTPSWRLETVYQIAAHKHGGAKATAIPFFGLHKLDDKEHIANHYDPAEPMNCYKNGERIRSTDQGFFNDHRKKI